MKDFLRWLVKWTVISILHPVQAIQAAFMLTPLVIGCIFCGLYEKQKIAFGLTKAALYILSWGKRYPTSKYTYYQEASWAH